MNELNVSAL